MPRTIRKILEMAVAGLVTAPLSSNDRPPERSEQQKKDYDDAKNQVEDLHRENYQEG